MNTPGFNAETSLCRTNIHYQQRSSMARATGVRAAQFTGRLRTSLPLALDCRGTCPREQVLIICENECRCCIEGGSCDQHGQVTCRRNPGFSGWPLDGRVVLY